MRSRPETTRMAATTRAGATLAIIASSVTMDATGSYRIFTITN